MLNKEHEAENRIEFEDEDIVLDAQDRNIEDLGDGILLSYLEAPFSF